MIGLEQVSFGYGENQETLSQVSAAIARGECVLLCGASGCGKTTVTKLINGLIPAFTPGCRLEGRVMVDGLAPQETPMYELAQRVGSVFQNPKSQFFNLDTDSELAFGLENKGRPPEEIRRRVEQAAETLHLQELRGKNIFSLSGGQKQLLAFGSVYAMGPEIYVLDEPTANLDQEAVARLHDQVAALKRQGCSNRGSGAPAVLSHPISIDRAVSICGSWGDGARLHRGAVSAACPTGNGKSWGCAP